MSMYGVDDAGFVDETFWVGLGEQPCLRAVAKRAISWLEGTHLEGHESEAAAPSLWREAEQHAYKKRAVIQSYRGLASCAALLATDAILKPGWLAPPLRNLAASPPPGAGAAAALCAAALAESHIVEEAPGIFSFDLFTADFCELLLREVDTFEATSLPRRRPNTMNRHGLIVNEIGMAPLLTELLRRVISPLTAAFFTNEVFAASLDHHHSFVVAYSRKGQGGDVGLDMHHDASEVTLNVCLGRGFRGGALRFCGRFGGAAHRANVCVLEHKPGRAFLHLGRQRHGADDIEAGERYNLIVWARSSAFRGAAAFGHVPPDGYPKLDEAAEPHVECLSQANDDDYLEQLRRHEARGGELPNAAAKRAKTQAEDRCGA